MAVNKVNLVGRLGADPTFHHIDKNNTVSRINVAVHDCDYDSSGNKEKVTNWITVILWNRLSYISKNLLCKGATVSVEGKVVKRSYTDKNGIRQYVLEVEAQRIECLCKPENKQSAEMDETDNEATYLDSEEPDYYDDPFGDEEDGMASYELQEETANNVVSEPLVVKRGKSLSSKTLKSRRKEGGRKANKTDLPFTHYYI